MTTRKKRREMTDKELRDYYDTHSTMEKGPLRPVKIEFANPVVLMRTGTSKRRRKEHA